MSKVIDHFGQDEENPLDRNVAAVRTYKMSVDSAALVQAAEDLLALTRILKEAWLFGKMQTVGTSEAEKRTGVASAMVFEGLSRLSAAGALEGAAHVEGVNGEDGAGAGAGTEEQDMSGT